MTHDLQAAIANTSYRITASTSVAAVIGDPVKHSLSPIIHNVGFQSLGIDWVYVAYEVKAGQARAALDAVRIFGLRGLSVTMPHKSDVADLVDTVSTAAQALKSVNTVEVGANGLLVGHSTDGDGLVASLSAQGVDVTGKSILILGAGGAARSIVDALKRHRSHNIVIANRSLAGAQSAQALAPKISQSLALSDSAALKTAVSSADIVINATSIGMSKDSVHLSDSPLSADLITPQHTVVDLVYHPIQTELLRNAQQRGAQTVDGLGMLVHQAALQQQIWTGFVPDVPDMYRAALQALS
ncbi:MAG: shikimate dehydrogenase [Actinomycetota bacterium]|nr:shikimate dehydrogenase [Actinomycetota bacterium]MDA3019228.1 shikimate dehydrogenase [Actinomycetota bacterium]